MFHRILIANRGEIAVRIIRTCREMEIETVAVYSTADAEALHVKLATRAVCIGPARAADSYLNLPAILTADVTPSIPAMGSSQRTRSWQTCVQNAASSLSALAGT